MCTVLSALSTLTSPTPQPREGDPTVILLILQMSKRRHGGFTTLPKATQTVSGRYGIQNQAMWPRMDAFGYSASNHPVWDPDRPAERGRKKNSRMHRLLLITPKAFTITLGREKESFTSYSITQVTFTRPSTCG